MSEMVTAVTAVPTVTVVTAVTTVPTVVAQIDEIVAARRWPGLRALLRDQAYLDPVTTACLTRNFETLVQTAAHQRIDGHATLRNFFETVCKYLEARLSGHGGQQRDSEDTDSMESDAVGGTEGTGGSESIEGTKGSESTEGSESTTCTRDAEDNTLVARRDLQMTHTMAEYAAEFGCDECVATVLQCDSDFALMHHVLHAAIEQFSVSKLRCVLKAGIELDEAVSAARIMSKITGRFCAVLSAVPAQSESSARTEAVKEMLCMVGEHFACKADVIRRRVAAIDRLVATKR
jgi:hypothetical protein